jgi:hypothetical protein
MTDTKKLSEEQRPRCQEKHPETGQCELAESHKGSHLAGYIMWAAPSPATEPESVEFWRARLMRDFSDKMSMDEVSSLAHEITAREQHQSALIAAAYRDAEKFKKAIKELEELHAMWRDWTLGIRGTDAQHFAVSACADALYPILERLKGMAEEKTPAHARAALEEELRKARLDEQLKHGGHKHDCATFWQEGGYGCDCGYEDRLAALRSPREEQPAKKSKPDVPFSEEFGSGPHLPE